MKGHNYYADLGYQGFLEKRPILGLGQCMYKRNQEHLVVPGSTTTYTGWESDIGAK